MNKPRLAMTAATAKSITKNGNNTLKPNMNATRNSAQMQEPT
jgi:hypothetical protein